MKTVSHHPSHSSEEWFSTWFDSPYYHILYQNRDQREAQNFINNLADFLNFQPRHRILDLACGRGRHAVYLNQKGLQVTGVDLSEENIAFARQYENASLKFRVHDMRKVLEECCFDFILNLFTSFGYFETDEENINVIQATKVNLKPEGRFVIDFLNPEKVIREMISYEEKTLEGIQFRIRKTLQDRYILKDIQFEADGQSYHFQERVKAIDYSLFQHYFDRSGMDLIHTFGNYQLESFTPATSDRMIFILEKRS